MAYLDHVGKSINVKVVFFGGAQTIARAEELHRRVAATSPIERLDIDEGPVALFQLSVPGVRGYALCLHLFWFDASRADDATVELILRGAEGLVFDGARPDREARARAVYPGRIVGELAAGSDPIAALKPVARAVLEELRDGASSASPAPRPPPQFALGGFGFNISGVFTETQQTPGRFAARAPGDIMFEALVSEGGAGNLDGWWNAQSGERVEAALASHRVVGVRAGERELYATDVAGDRLRFTLTVPHGAASLDHMRRLVFAMVEYAILYRANG